MFQSGFRQGFQDFSALRPQLDVLLVLLRQSDEFGKTRLDPSQRVGRVADHPPRLQSIGRIEMPASVVTFAQQARKEPANVADSRIRFLAKERLIAAVARIVEIMLADL